MNELSRFTLRLAHRQSASLDFDQASVALIRRLRLVAVKPLSKPALASDIKSPGSQSIAPAHVPSGHLPCFPVSVVGCSEWLDPLPYRWASGNLLTAH